MGAEYYLAIDVGATKTLLAIFDDKGEVICEEKFPTDKDYEKFKADLASCVAKLSKFEVKACCAAFPGLLDLKNGVGLAFGNEDWVNKPLLKDMEVIMPGTKVFLHNDAKLAGLSEALLLIEKYQRVLYLTLSTGVGGGVI
ncbi:ROK family protein, partial [Candidatus Saccharibacteria bacterium]|nr:ROK family protein [Candidatus Saccharibacteria bacterium]